VKSIRYITLRSVSSLNNPQNGEMNFCGNMKFEMLKIIIIIPTLSIISLLLISQHHNRSWKNQQFQILKIFFFLKKNKIICFINVETDPRLR